MLTLLTPVDNNKQQHKLLTAFCQHGLRGLIYSKESLDAPLASSSSLPMHRGARFMLGVLSFADQADIARRKCRRKSSLEL